MTAGGKTFTADSTGKISITSLVNGKYEAVVSMPNYAPRKVTIKVGAANDDIVICKYGDVNGDGYIDHSDFARMKHKILGWDVKIIYDETLDVNCDGVIDDEDSALLERFLNHENVTLGKSS